MAETKAAKGHGDGKKWWCVHQHQEATVEEGEERPDVTVEKGERVKVVHGPFKSKAEATARAELIRSKTTKGRLERGR